jgi:glycogen debranching enzyme
LPELRAVTQYALIKTKFMIQKDELGLASNPVYVDDRIHVLNHCDTFAILNLWGDILPIGKDTHGLYNRDTRFINRLQLLLDSRRPDLLSSNIKEDNETLSVDLTNPDMVLASGMALQTGMIHLRRSQIVREEFFHEKIEVKNFHSEHISVELSIRFENDFSDIFEVRGLKRAARGMLQEVVFHDGNKIMEIPYLGLDHILRTTVLYFSTPYTRHGANGTLYFPITLAPQEALQLDYSIFFRQEDQNIKPVENYLQAVSLRELGIADSKAYFTSIETDNEQFTHWIHRSQTDLVSLMADTPYGKYPYAGVPWYNTAFGRDGIITALQTLWLAPQLSKDVLKFLSAYQAADTDYASDAEPGKIFHEIRGGEMSGLGEVQFKKYYGTIDATPLYIILAGEYYDRTADLDTIKNIWPNIMAAIDWINNYGDQDGDGFVEYSHKAEKGLTNQAWKDSFDAVYYDSGTLAEPPLALCEVQGYVYAAKLHAAKLMELFGNKDRATELSQEANALKVAFNKQFWDDELNCYVLALDGQKRPCRIKSSNAGQVLFTGIAHPEKAARLVNTLMQPDMFNGWGIRTVSVNEPRYNPMSYHNGSVWPHDVSLIIAGFAKYGYLDEAAKLSNGLFTASLFLPLQRLPELFCGFEKRKGEGPTSYPVACSPQAWSVSVVFMLLQSLLQISIDPSKREISFHNPYLPSYLKSITISGLIVDGIKVELEIQNYHDLINVQWKNQPEDWKLILIK